MASGAVIEVASGATNHARPNMYASLNPKRTVNGRQVIRVIGDGLWPSCSRSIRKIFEHRVDASGSRWTEVTVETKKIYFEEFRKRYYWDEVMEELVKIAWDKIANA
ncbi:uncharacterized protein [Euphorbia lathyris]|uniref:uncharacterized protein n=1 Tax=Euphorbia lathyris TaxID=212925 RepID=UPI00331429C3